MPNQSSKSQDVNRTSGAKATQTRAALYLRISQDATGEALGVTRQREDCEELAKTQGWDITETYVDNDISAYKDRPGYNALLAAIANDEIDAIIAWAPDRIYRRLKNLEELIELIEAHKVEIRTVKAGDLDLSTAYGRMLARILGSVAAGEGEIKAERFKRSWRQRREAGLYAKNGNRTYGYTQDGEVIGEEKAVAQWMAEQVLAGKPIQRIVTDLEGMGVTTVQGNHWSRQGMKGYLMSPRIAGWSALNGEIVGEGNWEPLIDRETYEAVRALLGSRTRAYVPRKALLGGLLHCGAPNCGHRMITSGQSGQRTYRCPNRPNMRGCGRVSGNALPIEEVVEAYARQRLADPRVRKHIAELRAEGDGGPRAELAAIELRLTELEKQLDDPAISLQALTRAIERAQDRQTELRAAIAQRTDVTLPNDVDTDWPTDLASRRALVDLVVARVTLNPATKPSRYGFDPERVAIEGR